MKLMIIHITYVSGLDVRTMNHVAENVFQITSASDFATNKSIAMLFPRENKMILNFHCLYRHKISQTLEYRMYDWHVNHYHTLNNHNSIFNQFFVNVYLK